MSAGCQGKKRRVRGKKGETHCAFWFGGKRKEKNENPNPFCREEEEGGCGKLDATSLGKKKEGRDCVNMPSGGEKRGKGGERKENYLLVHGKEGLSLCKRKGRGVGSREKKKGKSRILYRKEASTHRRDAKKGGEKKRGGKGKKRVLERNCVHPHPRKGKKKKEKKIGKYIKWREGKKRGEKKGEIQGGGGKEGRRLHTASGGRKKEKKRRKPVNSNVKKKKERGKSINSGREGGLPTFITIPSGKKKKKEREDGTVFEISLKKQRE